MTHIYRQKVQKCHDDYIGGKINFEGCEIMDKAYKVIKDIVVMYLKLVCTGKQN